MARGWESKAVADQMEETGGHGVSRPAAREASPVVRARQAQLESLRLSRARTLAQLDRPLRAAHREMLQRTLRALDAQIEELK